MEPSENLWARFFYPIFRLYAHATTQFAYAINCYLFFRESYAYTNGKILINLRNGQQQSFTGISGSDPDIVCRRSRQCEGQKKRHFRSQPLTPFPSTTTRTEGKWFQESQDFFGPVQPRVEPGRTLLMSGARWPEKRKISKRIRRGHQGVIVVRIRFVPFQILNGFLEDHCSSHKFTCRKSRSRSPSSPIRGCQPQLHSK